MAKNLCLYVSKSHESGTQHLRRVVVDSKEKKRILQMCHGGVGGMHFGRDKIYNKVSCICDWIDALGKLTCKEVQLSTFLIYHACS